MNNESFFFDWLTFTWLMDNLIYIIIFMFVSLGILFFFPILLGYDLSDEIKKKEANNKIKD